MVLGLAAGHAAAIGTGIFNAHPTTPSFGGGNSWSIALGDIDGDGDLDTVVANSAQAQAVRLNDGAGNFSAHPTTPSFGAGDSHSIALGDIDGDGDLDAVVANTNGQAQTVWRNDGAGNFSAHPTTPSFGAGNSLSIALGDIDGDGDLDAVVANDGGGQAETVWLNDGAGNFSAHPTTPSFGASQSWTMALGDIDGDGDLDAVVANNSSQAETVWLNDGAGNFSAHPITPSFGSGDSWSIALGDIDGDGDLDAVVADLGGAQTVWLNDGAGTFSAHPTTPSFGAGDSTSIALGDVDGDGDLDAVVANSAGQAQTVWLNDGAGNFSAHPTTPSFGAGNSRSIGLGDIDGDGDLDAVVANFNQAQTVWLNLTAHPITASANPIAGGTVTCTPNPVPDGTDSTCTATANAGHTFANWSGDCAGATCTLTGVTSAKTVTANFTPDTYAIATAVNPGGAGTVTCTPNPVDHGTDSTCTATPNAGYTFANWSGDCAGATCTLTGVTSARSVTANFTLNTYAIATAVNPGSAGTVTCTPNPVDHGTDSTCTATPNAGYTFANWSGDCAGATCTLTGVTSARSVTANFTLNSYAIATTVNPPGAGTVTCAPNPVGHGGTSACTATANAGFAFANWSGDCTGATCTLTGVTSARSVTANFSNVTYAIATAVNPPGAGTVTCAPNPVGHGGTSACTATANAGFAFANWSGDCTGATCTLTGVTSARSVTANFSDVTYAIATAVNPPGAGTVTCTPNPVGHGGTSTCSASANAGFVFSSWSGDCTGATCTLSGVTSPKSVTAAFTATIRTFSGPSATGSGTITASFTGGGPACSFATSQLIAAPPGSPPVPPTSPFDVAFPHGLFDFTTTGCTQGGTITMTITYPAALPPGTVYWKYGPEPANATPHWYVMPATIAGNTVTFSITDGAQGDDDLAANGTIVDQGGPGVPGTVGPLQVPTLSQWALILLALMVIGVAAAAPKRGQGRKLT